MTSDVGKGKPEPPEFDAARTMLNRMRESAIARGEVRIDAAKARRTGERNAQARELR